MKKILTLVLAIVLAVSCGVTAFADPPELDTPVVEEDIDEMWASGTYTVGPNSTLNTATFNIPDHYFAFEMTATTAGGGTSSSTYRVSLKKGMGTRAAATYAIDGVTHKVDWINISTTGDHYFLIENFSNTTIYVTLTYYSWT